MRLLFATGELVVGGRKYPGFPLLIDDDGSAMEPAQSFLWDHLSHGRRQKKGTWANIGRALFDFFAYVETNNLDWRTPPCQGFPSVIDSYRDWSKGEIGLDPAVINQRLDVIDKFYDWAIRNSLIAQKPFRLERVRVSHPPGFLAHVDASDGKHESKSSRFREIRRELKFLVLDQVRVCNDSLPNETHWLMFQLMVRSGLRQSECRTFPEKYVFDPAKRRDLLATKHIRVDIDPRDMTIKYDLPRSIDVPCDLMEELWWYSVRTRAKRERIERGGTKFPTLFLTEEGRPYGDRALQKIFDLLSTRVGFHVHPHMLRHTYATYLLRSLRMSKDFQGDPLLYTRDRLGHADIHTTARYLHLVNRFESQLIEWHEDELDRLFKSRGEADGG